MAEEISKITKWSFTIWRFCWKEEKQLRRRKTHLRRFDEIELTYMRERLPRISLKFPAITRNIRPGEHYQWCNGRLLRHSSAWELM